MAATASALAKELRETIDELDRIHAEIEDGVRSASHFVDLETRFNDAFATARSAFRGQGRARLR